MITTMKSLEIFLITFITIGYVRCDLLKVHVLYEALCYDSVMFITRELHPHFKELDKYIELVLVPYGKAQYSISHENNYTFSCQHGPKECVGNKLQACALNQNKNQQQNVDYVNCVMKSRNPADVETNEACALQFNFNVESLKNCYQSEQGDNLLRAAGDTTKTLMYNLFFVPTVIFNEVYQYPVQELALYNIRGAVCSMLTTKPDFCKDVTF